MLQRGLSVVQRGLAVVLLTQWAHSRPTYGASVISLQQNYSLQQSYGTCWICGETTGWLKKTSREVRILPLYLSYNSISCQLEIIQAKETFEIKCKNVDNHKRIWKY